MTTIADPKNWVPASCTLPNVQRPLRVAEFDDLFAAAVRRIERPTATRLRLTLEPGPGRAAQARNLARRETACCSFFTFEVLEGDALSLDVTVPAAHAAVLDALAARAITVQQGDR